MVGKKKPKLLVTPWWLLRGKARKLYEQANTGKVVTYNLANATEILDLRTINNLPWDKAQEYLANIRNQYSNRILQKEWGISTGEMYKLCKKYEVLKPSHGGRKSTKNNITNEAQIQLTFEEEIKPVISQAIFNLVFSGEYNGAEVREQIVDIVNMLKQEKVYNFSLTINGK